jgi:hypothetical protein
MLLGCGGRFEYLGRRRSGRSLASSLRDVDGVAVGRLELAEFVRRDLYR